MWWLDPSNWKQVLTIFVNHVLAPYVDNLNLEDVRNGLEKGHFTLCNLRLKKGPLEKFLLPVDFVDGHLGKFTLSLDWQNFGNEVIKVSVEDLYLLVVPSSDPSYDAAIQHERAIATKLERLRLAELLCWQFEAEYEQSNFILDTPLHQGDIYIFIANLIDNVEVTVKNVHIRYEDTVSVPKHLFAAGVTLAGFSAKSNSDGWPHEPLGHQAHKLAQLEYLALYLDTNTTSLRELSHDEFVKKFTELISHDDTPSGRHFILKPVCGQGRIKVNRPFDDNTPLLDIQLVFGDIVVSLDDKQYQDIMALVDMYHRYIQRGRYHGYRYQTIVDSCSPINPSLALWKFATAAILDQVRDHQRRWTWTWFSERREERKRYVDLFKKKQEGTFGPTEAMDFEALERELSYGDLRLYRSIARSHSTARPRAVRDLGLAPSIAAEALRNEFFHARVVANLECGSFSLKTDPLGRNTEIMSVVLDGLHVTFKQRPDTYETSMSLTNIVVRDGSSPNTLYPLIVHVKDSNYQHELDDISSQPALQVARRADPVFFLKVETNPRDLSAGSVVTVQTHDMEIVYHRGYIDALHEFFKLPESRLQSVQAFKNWLMQSSSLFRWFSVAGQTLRMLFSLRVQDEREVTSADGSTFLLQLSASVKARIVPPSRPRSYT